MNDTNEVKLHFLDYWRVIKLRMGLILLTFFLVMVTAGVTTYFLPREYFSKVTMEVKQDNSGPISVFGSGMQRSYDPQFVATQFQILQKTGDSLSGHRAPRTGQGIFPSRPAASVAAGLFSARSDRCSSRKCATPG